MIIRPAGILVALLLLAGCGGSEPTAGGTAPQSGTATEAPARQASAPGAAVFIITPTDGATVTSPVTVKFGISGMTVAPAGTFADNTGHHHLLIDTKLDNLDQPIPSDAHHLHFGKGQTETTIELEPGRHTLQLVLGDGNHRPHNPPVMSDIVTITVK